MFKALLIEIKNIIFKSWFHFFRFSGLLFMPFVYAFSYIYAFYDPFTKVDQLPIKLMTASNNNGLDNQFGKSLIKQLEKDNKIKIGDLHLTLKMKNIYVDDSGTDSEFINKIKDESKNDFGALYVPNLTNDIDNLLKKSSSSPLGVVSALTQMIKDIKNTNHESEKFQIFNNYKKNYLIGFGVSLSSSMLGSTKFLLNVMTHSLLDYITTPDVIAKLTSASGGLSAAQLTNIETSLNKFTSSHIYDFEPFTLKSQMGEHAKYGYGLAPFFICVSMWIGGMVMTFAAHRKIYDYKITAGIRYFAKWFIISFGIVIQATIVMCSLYIIGFKDLGINHWGAMYGFSIIIGLIFASMIQGIRFSIHTRNIGLFIIIILLVLQMASGGGLFPLDTQSKFYQVLNKILPMSKGINILRETAFDTNWNVVFTQLGWLLMYLSIIPLAVIINQRRTIKIYLSLGKEIPLKMETKMANKIRKNFHNKNGEWGDHV